MLSIAALYNLVVIPVGKGGMLRRRLAEDLLFRCGIDTTALPKVSDSHALGDEYIYQSELFC